MATNALPPGYPKVWQMLLSPLCPFKKLPDTVMQASTRGPGTNGTVSAAAVCGPTRVRPNVLIGDPPRKWTLHSPAVETAGSAAVLLVAVPRIVHSYVSVVP